MIQFGIEFSFMGYRIIAIAINTCVKTCVNAFVAIICVTRINDSSPSDVIVAHEFKYCYKQQ